jgi:hypothetical protein
MSVPPMSKCVRSKWFGDRGYILQELIRLLGKENIQLTMKIRKKIKNKFVNYFDKLLLRKRAIIESVNDQLKNIS